MQNPEFYTFSVQVEAINGILLMISACLFCFLNRNPKYMRSFPLYAIVSVLSSHILEYFPAQKKIVYVSYGVFELIYFTYFLADIYQSKKAKRAICILTAISLIFTTYMFLVKPFNPVILGYNGTFILIECLVILLGCVEYIREALNNRDLFPVSREPAFWMVCGTLWYFVVIALTIIFAGYMRVSNNRDMALVIWSFNNYAQPVSLAFYLTGMLCTKKRIYSFSL